MDCVQPQPGMYAVTRCNESGTEFLVVQQCGAYRYCQDGLCYTQQCLPGTYYCMGRELRRCDELGSGYVVEQTCNGQQRCNAAERTCVDVCSPDPCSCAMFSPCCTANGACGCNFLVGGACEVAFVTGAERCDCQ
jgi:hypothetical protein